ncbi:hypothetical protein F7725_010176 [Dissostichus mawsoni]|uniref:Cadherin domain-containing protein n=1 Tax=Dissostichus mawsoni TaxID=36200 RepID=A0A7J5XQT0_DISMA|nr:hypothetical protein F7725_010176 [Dissostichus mawsoni]
MVLQKTLDREKQEQISLVLTAVDGGEPQMSGTMLIVINVLDVNDNAPVFTQPTYKTAVTENSPKGTVVATVTASDADQDSNDSVLDRETASQYNITVTCSDEGVPSLSSSVTLTLQISDMNDNAPVFDSSSYEAYIVENNTPGLSIFTVRARDADWNQNSRVSYILEDSSVNGVAVSSYVSVSADSGVIHAVRSFDYEQIKDFHFRVKAQDGGSPPLRSNVTVKILIQDQNDNPPQVLYPVQTGGSLVAEMVPRSADVGYLVTKVVAVDVDSGQNAWLSYKLQKATDRALFEVGLQNGEIRTIRQVTDKDAVKQRLTVIVEDNGQPSRSATVIVNVVVADSFPEVLSEFTDFQDKEYNDNLTFYLVLALAVVSFLFITCLVVIISVKIYRWRQSRIMFHSNLPVIPYYPPRYSDTLGTGTLQHVYNYEVCRTTDSRKSNCKFGRAASQNVLIMDPSSTGTMQRIQSEKSILDEPDSPLEVSSVAGQARYSVPEGQAEGSYVGNIARDLGLDVTRLISGKARIITKGSRQYVDLNRDKGTLVIKERIDREELCRKTTPCSFSFELILENPIQLYRVTVEIQPDGVKFIEMVLQTPLDREKEETHDLVLIASDGGEPHRSGTVRIHITVLDANDNAPVCSQPVYIAEVKENSPTGTVVPVASDADWGQNARVSYFLEEKDINGAAVTSLVSVNSENGVIHALRSFDYEQIKWFEFNVTARDAGSPPLSSVATVKILIQDQNDNPPQVLYPVQTGGSLVAEMVPRSADVGYLVTKVVAVDNGEIRTIRQVTDKDAVKQRLTVIVEDNGQPSRSATVIVNVVVADSFPEVLSEFTDFTQDKEYNDNLTFYLVLALAVVSFLFITCLVVIISVKIYRWRQSRIMCHSNLPVIPYYPPRYSDTLGTGTLQHVYNTSYVLGQVSYYIPEEMSKGSVVVRARDADWNQNARVSYILEDSSVNGVAVSSYVSVSADSGVIHAVRSFDYEQIKDFHFRVKVQDGGSPPLSSNVTVKILIQDLNDNPPQVLYPVQTGGSLVAEMVPRSSDVGYLVTKVVAVDVDSGQNAWLSYKLQKATDRALFEVGSQNGEIRTIRQVTDKDAVKQRLTVIVEDNGQPSRSATVIVNVVVADSFPEVLSEFTDFTQDKEYNDNLTFYLVLALAVVSFLFITCLVVIISVKIYRWRQSRIMFHSNLPVIPYYPPRYSDTLGTGTLQHVYNYEVCRTTDSKKSDCKFGRAGSQNVLIMDPSSTGTMQRIQSEKSILDEPDSPLELRDRAEVTLDREIASQYNITVTCSDEGVPSLSSSVTLTLTISDVNDNAPVFESSSYEAYIVENNTPGLSVFTVRARDADWNQNARISYILEDSSVNGVAVSSYVSVSADSGVIHAVRSFDYEQIKDFHFRVKAQDGGSPPLDQNDNPPQVLYPVQTGGSLVAEMVPRATDVGYLVTKVVAVDVDSGQNAWLSYKLQKATDRALFEVGLQNGEIRTIRQDNGQPSRSATVIVNVVVADSFPEVLSEFTDFTQDKEYMTT